MNDRLRYLEELYDGDGAAPVDADAAREFASFREMKALLDARPKQTPDASVVSAVLAAARGESAPQRLRAVDERLVEDGPQGGPRARRGDRLPVARERSSVLRIGAASALVVLLLAVAGILHLEILDPAGISSTTEPAISSAQRGKAADEQRENAVDEEERAALADAGKARMNTEQENPNPAEIAMRSPVASGADEAAPSSALDRDASSMPQQPPPSSSASAAESVDEELAFPGTARNAPGREAASAALAGRVIPTGRSTAADAQAVSWDERADVLEVYQHIEMISSGVEQGWEPPSVPLEMMPQQDAAIQPNLHQAGERQNPKP